MDANRRLDQLQATIGRKDFLGMDTSRERQEAGRIIRSFVPGEGERRTALHEAGHGVAMHVVGVRCKEAVVDGKAYARFQEKGSPRERALVAVAGSLAEDGTLDNMSEADRSILQKACESLAPRGTSVAGAIDGIVREARRLIGEHHDAIHEVADHLGTHGKSFGYEIGSIVERSMSGRQKAARSAAHLARVAKLKALARP